MKPSLTGTVLSIERCSLHDGPGIRTTVFLKGCPLRCLWCHNPESQDMRPQLALLGDRCTRCGACRNACPAGLHEVSAADHTIDRRTCQTCGLCVQACPAGALGVKGTTRSVEDVLAEVEKDRPYYESSSGGLTLSGGEPTAQFAFCKALLEQARQRNIHTCLETCLFAPQDRLLQLAPHVNLFLADWKESDPHKHLRFTGVDLDPIRRNLLALDHAGAATFLRCPIVPGLNDREDHLQAIAQLANQLENIRGIEVMPYHPMGASKARSIGRDYPLPDTPYADPDQAHSWRQTIASATCVDVY
jgi:pyruvate formate lyase activating enzyme